MHQFFIFLLFLAIPNIGQSQKWFDSSDTWVYKYSEGFSAIDGYSEFSNARDTLVNGKNAKAFDVYYKYYSQQFQQQYEHDNIQVFYEEDNRVYSLNVFDSLYLIYDFNLEVGDSISYERPLDCASTVSFIDPLVLHLEEIDTITLGNLDLQVQHFSYYDRHFEYSGTVDVIEKFGSLNTNFNLNEIITCAWHPEMERLCNGSSLAEEINFLDDDCYFVISSIENVDIQKLKVYPNPANNIVTIQTEDINFTLRLFNVNGMLEGVFQNKSIIDVSKFNAGMYYMEMISDNKRSYTKLIIN